MSARHAALNAAPEGAEAWRMDQQIGRPLAFTQNGANLVDHAAEAHRMATEFAAEKVLSATDTARIEAAELQTRVWCNPHLVIDQQDAFFKAYGVRRGDDLRGNSK